MNTCNSINVHQRNKPVENWYIVKYREINKRTKKGTRKNICDGIHDVAIPLCSNKHTIKSLHNAVVSLYIYTK